MTSIADLPAYYNFIEMEMVEHISKDHIPI